mgnify:CR=1 FL=1
MTVSSTDLKTIITAGGEVSFAFSFPVAVEDDIKVYFCIAGIDTIQSGYTVVSDDLEQGGNVVFDVAPTAGTVITIIRQLALTQETNYVENDPFPAEAHEDALDKLTMITQQLGEITDRCIRLPVSDAIAQTTDLPQLEDRILKFLYFDQDGMISVAEGQMIESAHTHTLFPNLTIQGVLTTGFLVVDNIVGGSASLTGLNITGGMNQTGDAHILGNIECLLMGSNTLTANYADVVTLNVASTATINTIYTETFIVSNAAVTYALDVGNITLNNAGSSSRIYAKGAGATTTATLELYARDSFDDSGENRLYISTGKDNIFGYQIKLNGMVRGTTFRATDYDYDYPTYQGDANVFISAGDKMVFSIDKDNIGDPQSFKWISNNWNDDSGTQLMQLTDSGTLNVSGSITQNGTQVSLVGHTHDDRYYTETEVNTISGVLNAKIPSDFYSRAQVDTISGTLSTKIDTTSGTLQSAINGKAATVHSHDDLYYTEGEVDTISGALNNKIPMNEFYFGTPTTSGTFRMTTVSGNLEVQWYDGIDWYTRQTISGAIS